MTSTPWVASAALASAVLLAGAAGAATLSEADMPGGAFGSSYNVLTQVASGYESVTGTGNGGAYDNFVFTGLPTGAQTLTFTFSAPRGYDFSYSAGATLLYDTLPFDWAWDGQWAGQVQVGYSQPSQTFQLNLSNAFAGNLYLALNFTHGSNLAYTISAPSNAAPVEPPVEPPAPVPLPAAGLLLAFGLAGLGGAYRLKR